MAQLSTFATTASNVVVNATERRITISSEVVEIDGVLDPPTGFDDWGGWEIVCQSSGGFRSTSGASGTLGGGVHSLKIVEKTNGHRFGGDNFSGSNGANARFAGDATNVLKYHNIVWIVETGDRSDFDFGRGTAANGSAGQKVELSGVSLYQLTQAGQTAHFNHYSGQTSIKVHSEVGYGFRVENRTNGHAIEFSTAIQSGAVVEGLVVANVASPTNNGASSNARVAVRLAGVAASGTLTLSGLNTPNITDVDGSSDKTLLLVDPVGLPTITSNWNRHVNIEVQRTVPFAFTGATPAGETMHARAQTSGGAHATASMTGATGAIRVRTQRTASSSATSWTNYNTYRFFMTGLGFRKYALNTNQTIANIPATITAALTPDVLPDGTAISAINAPTAQNPPDNLSEVIRGIKDLEVLHPVTSGYPVDSLAYVDGTKVKINAGFSFKLDSAQSGLFVLELPPSLSPAVEMKSATTMAASNGLTTIDATGSGKTITLDSVTEDEDVFMLDSTGQKSIVNVTNSMGASVLFSLVKASDGTTTGSATVSSGSTGAIAVAAKGLGSGYKLVGKRPGHSYFSADVDLTGGGAKAFTAPAQQQIVQPDGSASYSTSVTVPATLTMAFSHTGVTPAGRVECGNATFSARQIFKAFDDELATADGAAFMGLGGHQLTYTLSALKGNEIVLGAHTKIKRKASTDINATIRATLYAPDDAPVDGVNGDVQTIEGLDIPAVATEIWSSSTRTLTSGGGGGGGASADAIWEYRRPIQTYTPTGLADGDLMFSSGDMDDFATGVVVRLDNNGGYSGAANNALFYARDAGAGLQLFVDRADAIDGTQNARTRLTGSGTIGNVRLSRMTDQVFEFIDDIAGDVWSEGTRTLTTSAAPSASAVASAVWASDDAVSEAPTAAAIASSVWGASTRTLTTSAAPSASAIADAVWDEIVDPDRRGTISMRLDRIDGENYYPDTNDVGRLNEVSNEDPIVFTNLSTYTGLTVGTTYYVQVDSDKFRLYGSADDARGGFDPLFVTGFGTDSSVRFNFPASARIGTGALVLRSAASDVWKESTRTLTSTAAPTASQVASSVWGASARTLTTSAPSAADVADAVWSASSRTVTGGSAPTASEIADEVWSEIIDGGITEDLTITPSAKAGDGFSIDADDAALISNGDAFEFTNDGGYTGISTGTTYYAFVGSGQSNTKTLYVYDSKHAALTPGSAWRQPGSTGTPANVRIVFASKRPIGSASLVLHRILTGLAQFDHETPGAAETAAAVWATDLDPGLAGTQDIRAAIRKLNTLMGSNYIETNIDLQKALRLMLAVLAGKLNVTNSGGTLTFHRVDSSQTAIVSAAVSNAGRSNPTIDP